MRYIGTKTATLPRLTEIMRLRAPEARSLCDPFAGTCSVSRHFKSLGFRIVTGDLLRLSHVLQICYIRLNQAPIFDALLASGTVLEGEGPPCLRVLTHLSSLPGRHDFVTEHFSPVGCAGRLFFTPSNAGRVDAIRVPVR